MESQRLSRSQGDRVITLIATTLGRSRITVGTLLVFALALAWDVQRAPPSFRHEIFALRTSQPSAGASTSLPPLHHEGLGLARRRRDANECVRLGLRLRTAHSRRESRRARAMASRAHERGVFELAALVDAAEQ